MSQQTGKIGELLARAYLERLGMQHIASNVRLNGGEIDLVMRDKDTLVFCEVKTRLYAPAHTGWEAISAAKQAAISRAAIQYIHKNGLHDLPVRFDAVVINGVDHNARIEHQAGAFDLRRGRYFV